MTDLPRGANNSKEILITFCQGDFKNLRKISKISKKSQKSQKSQENLNSLLKVKKISKFSKEDLNLTDTKSTDLSRGTNNSKKSLSHLSRRF